MRGGKRENAGRKKVDGDKAKKTVVIRVDECLIPIIKLIQQAHAEQNGDRLKRVVMCLHDTDPFTELMTFLKPYRD